MFKKVEFFGAVGISLLAGVAIGYSKAREIFLEALLKSTTERNDSKEEEP